MSKRKLIHKEIDDFYSGASEETRLETGLGPLEFERNKELIARFLPQSGSIVLDVGGGPGAYAEWLSQAGHEVYLIDPVEKHIRLAAKRAGKMQRPFRYAQGEARQLDFDDNFADVALLHGPLYHLQDKAERMEALAEARRVLKPGGIMLGFAINTTASVIAGLQNGYLQDPDFFAMCREELATGSHNPPETWPGLLPEAYFHQPAGLREEAEQSGYTVLGLIAVEGMAWLDNRFYENWFHPKKKKALLDLLAITEKDPALLPFSPHMMVAAKKA